MAYVTPNSTIELFAGVPLNKDAEDTLYFASRADQNTYFGGLTRTTLSDYSYIRTGSEKGGAIRIAVTAASQWANLFKVNYLRFKNTSHENKWFYAFVTGVLYVSEECAEISYEFDDLQTWLPGVDYTLTECLVKRQHQTGSDNIGDNTEAEPVQVSEYHPKGYAYDGTAFKYVQEYDVFGAGYWIAVRLPHHTEASTALLYKYNIGAGFIVWDSGMLFPATQMFDNVPCGDLIALFDGESSTDIAELEKLTRGAGSKILGMWVIPKAFLPANSAYISTDWVISNSLNTFSVNPKVLFYATVDGVLDDCDITVLGPITVADVTLAYNAEFTTLPVLPGQASSYTVKNKKVFTNPYCYYEITAPNGQKISLSFEDLHAIQYDSQKADNKPYLKVIGSILDTQISAIPIGDNRFRYGYDKQLGLPKPPIGSFSGQTDKSPLISLISGVVELGASAGAYALGGIPGTILSSAASQTGLATSKITDKASSSGVYNMANLGLWGQGMRAFSGAFMYAENFKAIDEYFDAYGYTQNRYMVPDITHRKYWTYVQTEGAHFSAVSASADAMQAINDRFNRGVRFHKSAATIGNLHSYTNAIIS